MDRNLALTIQEDCPDSHHEFPEWVCTPTLILLEDSGHKHTNLARGAEVLNRFYSVEEKTPIEFLDHQQLVQFLLYHHAL